MVDFDRELWSSFPFLSFSCVKAIYSAKKFSNTLGRFLVKFQVNFSVQCVVTFCIVRGRWVSVRNEVVSVLFFKYFFKFLSFFFKQQYWPSFASNQGQCYSSQRRHVSQVAYDRTSRNTACATRSCEGVSEVIVFVPRKRLFSWENFRKILLLSR